MKKILRLAAVILAVCLIGALCACSSGGKTGNAGASQTPSAGETASPAEGGGGAAAKGDGNDQVLSMGTNAEFPPYEYYDGDKIVGIDAEIAQAIADKLGMTLEIKDMAFDSIITAVDSGKVDMGMAGMTVTDERLESVNFSKSYATGVQVVIVGEDSPISSVDDLLGSNNYAIGVQTATTGDLYATWDIEDKGLGTVQRYNKGADAVAALVSGKIDCVIIDNEPAKAFVAANTGLKILETEYAVENYAICIDKDNTELLEKVNSALDELIADGTVQAIVDKYIGQ
jgi:polar amino acid transport system substrate-binding protein